MGARVDIEMNDGWTPLHSAAEWDCAEVAQLLIENGAKVIGTADMILLYDVIRCCTVLEYYLIIRYYKYYTVL